LADKITLKDIADLAGISRNTVSKIVNGHYKGDRETQEKVIKLLQENNYKGMGSLTDTPKAKTILLLSGGMIQKGFFASLLSEIQQNELSRDYRVIYLGLQEEELKNLQIPNVIKDRQVDGIVCLEIFDKNFIETMLSHEIPTVFLDFISDIWDVKGNYDVVLMNNVSQTYTLTSNLIMNGCRHISFVGDYTRCISFSERYQGYCKALSEHNIALNPHICIGIDDEEGHFDSISLWSYIANMEIMPDAFVVANDSLAIRLMRVLEEHNIKIPEDVSVVGFDNISESIEAIPPLTTVDCNQEALSKTVLSCLNQRISQHNRPKNVVYVDTTIIYRGSC
jgi:LacI family transcriptional regulator